MMCIITPVTESDFQKYYQLRYEVLRKPWAQPPGSEKAEDDAAATHALLLHENQKAIGVCRLHLQTATEAQIRFMAIHADYHGQGFGKMLLHYMHEKAREQGATCITLQARENAVNFYRSCGYEVVAKTHLLFGEIQHYKMMRDVG